MINQAIMKKLTILESKIKDIESHLVTIADSIQFLAKEQRIIRRKHSEEMDILRDICNKL